MVKETDPPILGQLDYGAWIHLNHQPFLEDNTITAPFQKGDTWLDCPTSGEAVCSNSTRTFHNFMSSPGVPRTINAVIFTPVI